MASGPDNDKYVCHACISEDTLAAEVKRMNRDGICSYCGNERKVATLWHLAGRIHTVLQREHQITPSTPVDGFDHFMAAEGRWERRGDSVALVLAELAGLNKAIVRDIRDMLHNLHDYDAVRYGDGDPLYDTEAMYEPRIPDDSQFQVTWKTFREQVQTHARFFGPEAEEMLHFIFGDLTSLTAFNRRPVIREIGPGAEAVSVWRARVAQSIEERNRILISPSTELGPPPPAFAEAGRMNPDGIPVFYGATELETCVSEVRPPVGSFVVVGRFDLLKKVRILDLDALSLVYPKGSVFDPGYAEKAGRAAFLGHLRNEIGRPVMPRDETLEYVATQVVAEYLAHKASPGLDGIIFRSAQTGGEGHNLVLFNHARAVEPYILPTGTTSEVSAAGRDDSSDVDISFVGIHVLEVVPSDSTEEELQNTPNNDQPSPPQGTIEDETRAGADKKPVLKLDMQSFHVLAPRAVKYDYTTHRVTRSRLAGTKLDNFDVVASDASLKRLLDE